MEDKSWSVVQHASSSACSKFASGTHLHNRRCELPLCMLSHSNDDTDSERGELPPLATPELFFSQTCGYPDGGSNWKWLQRLWGRVEHFGQGGGGTRAALRRVGFSAQELDSFRVRWRSGFPRGSGAASAFQMLSGCTTGFQMLSGLSDAPTLTTRCRCRAATDHRINIARLVLRLIWNGEWSSGNESKKRTQTQNAIGEDARTNIGRRDSVSAAPSTLRWPSA